MNKKIIILLASISLSFIACKNSSKVYTANGTFEATELIVSAESNGRIIALYANEGKLIPANELLLQVDSTQLYLQKLALIANNKGLQALSPNIKIQTAALEDKIEALHREQGRIEKLVAAKAANTKQLDDIRSELAMTQSQLDALSSSLSKNRSQIGAQSSSLEVQMAQIQDLIDKCSVRSPIKATVLQRYVELGEMANVGRPLLRLAVLDTLTLRAYVPSSELAKIRLNELKEVRIDFGTDEMKSYQGRICWIAEEAEFTPKNVQSKDERDNLVYAVKVSVANDGYIKIGMYGELVL